MSLVCFRPSHLTTFHPTLAWSDPFYIGWLCATSWETGIASAAFIAGTTIQGLIILNNADYVPKNWHGTLLTMAIAVVSILFNTVLAKRLPMVEGVLVVLHLVGVVIMVPLWVLSPISKGGAALTTYNNGGGWNSVGLSTMVGMLPIVASMMGLDCSVHMGKNKLTFPFPYSVLITSTRAAEETKDSSRTLPVSLMAGFFINAFIAIFVGLTV